MVPKYRKVLNMAKQIIERDGIKYSVHPTKASGTGKELKPVELPLYESMDDYTALGFTSDELLSLLRASIVIRLQARRRSAAKAKKMPQSFIMEHAAQLVLEDPIRYANEDGTVNQSVLMDDLQALWECENA